MKCISCGNLIPDASSVCPYCNSKVEPAAPVTPVFNTNEGNSVVPNTPSQPVLPQDQNMVNTPVAPATPIETAVSTVTPVVENTSTVTESAPVAPAQPVQPEAVNVTSVETTPVAPVQSVEPPVQPTAQVTQTPVVEPTSVAPTMNSINPQGEVIDGTKIASTLPPKEKKSKKGLIIGLVIALIVLLIGGLAVFAYFYEFKSADKRLEAVVTNLMSFTNSVKNDAIEKSSGKYNVDVKLSYGDTTMSGALKGTYAVDLENKIMDYTFDLESLNLGEELLPQPLNVELYLNDSKAYVLLENFYENYIYTDFPEFDEMLSSIEQNDIDYAIIINAVKNATVAGTKALSTTQSIEDVTINGVKKKTNVVKINMTAQNQKLFVNSFVRNLANNTRFTTEMAKISEYSAEQIKENMLSSLEENEYENSNTTIDVYTTLMGNALDGIKITIKDEETITAEMYPVTNGYGLNVKEGTNDVLEATIADTNKVTSTTKETTSKVNMTLFSEGVAYKIEATIGIVEDVNPKVEKVNVKNSINYQYLTQTDIMTIYDKVKNFGKLGLMIDMFVNQSIGGTSDVTQSTDLCSIAYECVDNGDGTSTCKACADETCSTIQSVTCANAVQ